MTVPQNLGDSSIGDDALAIGLYCTLVTPDLKDGVVLPANGTFLRSFGADIFFNDQMRHCGSAADFAATEHVSYKVKNETVP